MLMVKFLPDNKEKMWLRHKSKKFRKTKKVHLFIGHISVLHAGIKKIHYYVKKPHLMDLIFPVELSYVNYILWESAGKLTKVMYILSNDSVQEGMRQYE